jgi:hypothetical protein
MARPGFHGEQFARATDAGNTMPALIQGASIAADWLRATFGRMFVSGPARTARQAG